MKRINLIKFLLIIISVLFTLTACGGGGGSGGGSGSGITTSTLTTYYLDKDEDKHGDLEHPTEAKTQPNRYVFNSDDCDDNNPNINPDAIEICDDGIDQDCNGADETCPTDPNDIDNDRDNFTPNQGDCDDNNPNINPDAIEIRNGIDDNCDGAIDDNPPNRVVGTISVGDGPYGIAITPNGEFALVTCYWDDEVLMIRISDEVIVNTIPVGNFPYGIAIDSDGEFAYVANKSSDTVSEIRISDGVVVRSIFVSPASDIYAWASEVAISPDGEFLFVLNTATKTVPVIRISDWVIVDILSSEDYPGSKETITPDGEYKYVANGYWDDSVSVIRTSDETVVYTIPVGDKPGGTAITPDGEFVYVTNSWDDSISVIGY